MFLRAFGGGGEHTDITLIPSELYFPEVRMRIYILSGGTWWRHLVVALSGGTGLDWAELDWAGRGLGGR